MPNEQDRKQDPAAESDISKSQSQQQPLQGQAGQQRETGEQRQFETGEQGQQRQFETGEQGQQQFGQDTGASPDESLQGDTLSQQRTDIEGGSLGSEETEETESGFVGSKGQQDRSSELIDEQDFDKDGQGVGGEE